MIERLTTYSLLLIVCAAALSIPTEGFAQNDPLAPKIVFPRVGVDIGLDYASQDGSYFVGCGTFNEGSLLNLTAAISYDSPLSEALRVEGQIGYRQRNVSGSYDSTELTYVRTSEGFTQSEVTYENVGSGKFSYLFVQPSIKWYPTKELYIGVGFNAGLSLGAETEYSKDIVTKVVESGDGELVEVFYPDADSPDRHSRVFPSEDPETASTILIDPLAFIGLDLRLGRRFYFGPRITYSHPIMSVIGEPELKISSIMGTIGIRYDLK